MATTTVKPEETQVKKKPTTPWKQARILTGVKIRDGFTGRWCRMDTIDKKLAEGWEFVKGAADTNAPITLIDGTKINNCIRRRNLILMEMPNEMVESRNEYFRQMGDLGVTAQKEEFERQARSEGITPYGEGLQKTKT